MTDSASDYLDDIIEAAKKIQRFTKGMTVESFREDEMAVDAVLRNFEVIGEAAKNVPDDVQREYDDVPWSEMAGMRDKLIHGYADVDLDIVWTTIDRDLPELTKQVERVRADRRNQE